MKLWSSQLWTQFLQLRKEARKIQDFNWVWTRDLAIPVRPSNQLSYEANDVGSWSFVGSNVPVRNESTMKWYMKWIIYELRRWNQVKLWFSQLWTQFLQLRKEARKFRTSTGFGPVTSRYRCDALTNWAMKPLTLEAGHRENYDLRELHKTMGLMRKNNSSARPVRAFCILVHFFVVLFLVTTWIDQIWGCIEDVRTRRNVSNCFPNNHTVHANLIPAMLIHTFHSERLRL